MVAELINTGTELMLGRVLNTHQHWLCRRMADIGYPITRQVAIPDSGSAISEAVRESLSRAELIITTGGLGPTSDDITRERIAQLLAKPLTLDNATLDRIQQFYRVRKIVMPERARVQAMVIEGARIIENQHGTAPGLAIQVQPNNVRPDGKPALLIMLPGPPRELRPMFSESVVPLIKALLPLSDSFVCRTLRTTGLGESLIQERIGDDVEPLVSAGLDLGYCCGPSLVDVRLAARGTQALRMVADAEHIVRERIGSYIFGVEDDELPELIVRLLTERKQTLTLAESCTGGFISHQLTNVPGASVVLPAGLVTYSNAAKSTFLHVKETTLAEHGAVSEAVAIQMADGARERTGSDYALAVTGIAGPSGGTDAKPVGIVFVALAGPRGTVVRKYFNPYDRQTFKQMTAQQALEMLRRELLK
jgi:nicotinamide-nucleotide amidase